MIECGIAGRVDSVMTGDKQMLNLAEYAYQLEKQGLSDSHIDHIPWVALMYRENPGIRSFIDSLKDGYLGPQELYERIIDPDSAYGTNVYK